MCLAYKYFAMYKYSLKVSENDTKSCFVSVFVGWHFSGGGSILLAASLTL